ncbi:D-alanyl-D-alanine carboxypeptidase family protein [Micropruina sonneratiae]|uniref:D-alanyl-D-alanine carboxypeptidase family protein n=1 Tax=Micropruina sonneratiae TaxID=2986940 RepID=UPI00222639B2|nr:D-alanyl-D-alanine carboxypeptidase family protein [Micropruina sp. KQZ13P-5]MCW3156663.1 D-alanyl-D-alanine carboxypeptidase family protein [Micropruina sp. KQZ13P-5]
MRRSPCPTLVTTLALGTALLAGCSATATPGGGSTPAGSPTWSPTATVTGSASGSPTASGSAGATASASGPASTAAPSATSSARPTDTRTRAQRNEAFTVNGVPVISKKYPINADYRRSSVTQPYGLTKQTQAALTAMTAAANRDGVRMLVRSGYRSYALQKQILDRKIIEYGSEEMARRYNAAPGRSEHQTGLAVDLWDGVTWGVGVRNTKVGRWLWRHAWEYGFILRYPDGKEAITGYAFEPWHYRYVGKTVAKAFGPRSNLTLEEHLGLA